MEKQLPHCTGTFPIYNRKIEVDRGKIDTPNTQAFIMDYFFPSASEG
jgi:hypothetical protein